ncbi:hypothetical protein [Streptomyces sp. NPDC029674]|uniref:hypothetical protein n=1 Tax=Streptomyces sp. NPDC029674 TaxID=3365297 RepID=UPI00384FAA7B
MDPTELRTLYDRLSARLATSENEVVWQGPASDRPKQAASLGDLADGHVAEQRLCLADAGEFAGAVDRVTAWVIRQGR